MYAAVSVRSHDLREWYFAGAVVGEEGPLEANDLGGCARKHREDYHVVEPVVLHNEAQHRGLQRTEDVVEHEDLHACDEERVQVVEEGHRCNVLRRDARVQCT